MKPILFFLYFALITTSVLSSKESCHGRLNQTSMLCTEDGIYVALTSRKNHTISAYSFQGHRLWEWDAAATITAWRVLQHHLIVFSKEKKRHQTHLTCIDRFSGEILWQSSTLR